MVMVPLFPSAMFITFFTMRTPSGSPATACSSPLMVTPVIARSIAASISAASLTCTATVKTFEYSLSVSGVGSTSWYSSPSPARATIASSCTRKTESICRLDSLVLIATCSNANTFSVPCIVMSMVRIAARGSPNLTISLLACATTIVSTAISRNSYSLTVACQPLPV